MRKPAVPKTKTGKSQELNSDAPRCGLCGKRGGLIQTECCGQWICDDEDNYVLFSYARNSGAKLAPGNSIGSMMFSNSLTLSAGSTTMLEISKAPLANDLINVLGNLTYGGTLVVTNPGAVMLTAGDSFPLFNALSHASSFNSLVLPPLGTNLMWDTNGFIVSGTLAVISTAPPAIDSVATLGDGNFRLIFSGPTGQDYELRASTNLALLPVTLWDLLNSGTFGNSPVIFDDLQATNYPQRFYLLQLP
jgi:hypothetical protein